MNDFKKLHNGSKLLHLPNAWDAGSARLFESLGAPAIATTSAGVAWAAGYADGDNMPADVAIAVAINMARVLTVPLSVDLENGYSDDADVVAQTAMKLVDAGVAGINLKMAAVRRSRWPLRLSRLRRRLRHRARNSSSTPVPTCI